MEEKYKDFIDFLNSNSIEFTINEPLSKHCTWKIGGPADIFVNIKNTKTLQELIYSSTRYSIPTTILGNGSNVLISDDGIRGLVIKNSIDSFVVVDGKEKSKNSKRKDIQSRLDQINKKDYYNFDEINYDESGFEDILIQVGSGYYLPKLINDTISQGYTGLQWFSGIPATLGGAIYNNIHGGSHFISEFIESVEILDTNQEIKHLNNEDLNFDYDYSIFHENKNIILTAKLKLKLGHKEKALAVAMKWAQTKRLQPYKSAGCCYKNLDTELTKKLNLASSGWGYIIEHKLNLKGFRINDAQISTKHAAFIENLGNAKATDVLAILDQVYAKSLSVLGIKPKLEIFLLGFDTDTINKYS